MLSKIKHIVRQAKITYVIYNLLHRGQLRHNPPLYKKYGINKRYFSTISSKDFPKDKVPEVHPSKVKLEKVISNHNLSPQMQDSLQEFERNGYAILRNFFSQEEVRKINEEVDTLLTSGELKLRYANRKIMFSHRIAKKVEDAGANPALLDIILALLDGKPVLYQSINFPNKGSEQRMHSDSVHLTTYPRGGMLGVWVALEKIDDDNGPISYLPESHRLPYLMNEAYDNEGSFLSLGQHDYTAYEEMIESEMSKTKFEKKIFHAEPGDVLIWHANLMHGGEAHKDPNRTRKSLVMHYFKDECIWYHELSQRPALYPPKMD